MGLRIPRVQVVGNTSNPIRIKWAEVVWYCPCHWLSKRVVH